MVGKRSHLIVLVLLLGLGSAAEAGFQIGTRYLDDRPFDPDTDLLDINESLYLSIWTDETVWGIMERYDWALLCDSMLAEISDGEAGPDAKWGVVFYGSAPIWLPSVPEQENGQSGAIGGDELDPGLYLDKFVYTPKAVGDATVRFLELHPGLGEIVSVPHSIVIRQVPEPMTVVLLGLGGFFVRLAK